VPGPAARRLSSSVLYVSNSVVPRRRSIYWVPWSFIEFGLARCQGVPRGESSGTLWRLCGCACQYRDEKRGNEEVSDSLFTLATLLASACYLYWPSALILGLGPARAEPVGHFLNQILVSHSQIDNCEARIQDAPCHGDAKRSGGCGHDMRRLVSYWVC